MSASTSASAPVPARIEHLLELLVRRYAADSAKAHAARAEYEGRRGKVHQDDELWEAWSAAFVEWYVVECATERGQTAVARWLTEEEAASAQERRVAEALATSHRSLFEVRQMARGRVELLDLLGGAEFSVVEPRALFGVEVGDVAELRLLGVEGEVYFGRTFVYHPRAARAAIVERASAMLAAGASRREVIDRVAGARVTLTRYRHVPVARVYERMS